MGMTTKIRQIGAITLVSTLGFAGVTATAQAKPNPYERSALKVFKVKQNAKSFKIKATYTMARPYER
jgi:hypothetical protein